MRVAVLKEDNCQPKKCMDECMTFAPLFETAKNVL